MSDHVLSDIFIMFHHRFQTGLVYHVLSILSISIPYMCHVFTIDFPHPHIFRTHVTPWPLCWAWALASPISPVTPASALEIGLEVPAVPASRGAWPAGQSSPCEVSLVQCPSSGAETGAETTNKMWKLTEKCWEMCCGKKNLLGP